MEGDDKRVYEISLPEDNRCLPHHLIIVVPGRKNIIRRFQM